MPGRNGGATRKVLLLVACTVALGGLTAESAYADAEQPYVVYEPIFVELFTPTQVGTEDQFDPGLVTRNIVDYDFIMNPADKTHLDTDPFELHGAIDFFLHYTWNKIMVTSPGSITVTVTDQFGTSIWTIENEPTYLLTPTSKCVDLGCIPAVLPPDRQHYQCYLVEDGPTPGTLVRLEDQFDPTNVDESTVGVALWLCSPADKDSPQGGAVEFPRTMPDLHLACYDIPDKTRVLTFEADHQFGSYTGSDPIKKFFCVDATKKIGKVPALGSTAGFVVVSSLMLAVFLFFWGRPKASRPAA